MKTIFGIVAFLFFILISCETADDDPILTYETVEEDSVPSGETVEEPPVPVNEPDPVLEPEEVETHYEVPPAVYEHTFEEIEELIVELNSVISKRQFDYWTEYLSSSYIRTYKDDKTLAEINQYPQLRKNGIVLESLKDYFDWVVVPSHSRAVLDEIVFVGENEVIAYSFFEGKRAKLYELERLDGEWKITVW